MTKVADQKFNPYIARVTTGRFVGSENIAWGKAISMENIGTIRKYCMQLSMNLLKWHEDMSVSARFQIGNLITDTIRE